MHVFALTGNAWLQPPLEWRIVPYAGVGIGPALQIREGRSSITRTDLDQISGVFARQLGAGLRIGISKRLSADLGSPPFRGRRRRAAALPWRPRFRPGSVALNQLSRMRWQIPSEPLAHEQRQTKTGAAVRVCCAARRFS